MRVTPRKLLVLLALLLVTACGADATPDGRLRVVATTDIVGDVVARVGGERVALTTLIESGQDPHVFEPSARQLAAAAGADIIFTNGFGLEEQLLDTLTGANERGAPLVELSEGIEPLAGHAHEEGEHEDEVDPHVWFDVANVIHWTDRIEAELVALDPEGAAHYRENAAAYRAELETLDAELRGLFARIPAERRRIVTAHDSLGYLARAYGLEIVGSVNSSVSSAAEPSAADLAALVARLETEPIRVIFVDYGASDTLASVVADEAGMSIVPLYTGALGPPESGADSYLGLMRTNSGILATVLGEPGSEEQ